MSLADRPGLQWWAALRTMARREYWTRPNTVEFFAFVVKGVIIIPGLLFGIEIWWLYILALASSLGLIWSSTAKTLPTLIWFNILWSVLAATYLIRYFLETA
jgi:hypothetical protein